MTRDCELRISDFGLARERPNMSESFAEYSDGEGITKVTVTFAIAFGNIEYFISLVYHHINVLMASFSCPSR